MIYFRNGRLSLLLVDEYRYYALEALLSIINVSTLRFRFSNGHAHVKKDLKILISVS